MLDINIQVRDNFLVEKFSYFLDEKTVRLIPEKKKSQINQLYWDHLDPACCSNDAFHLHIQCEHLISTCLEKKLTSQEFEKLWKNREIYKASLKRD